MKFNAQIKFLYTIVENSVSYYEHYVLGKISLDEFKLNHQKL